MNATKSQQRKIEKRINLTNARIKKNLTRKELAKKLEVSDEHIKSLEYGRVNPSISLMFSICSLLDSTPDHLFGDVVNK